MYKVTFQQQDAVERILVEDEDLDTVVNSLKNSNEDLRVQWVFFRVDRNNRFDFDGENMVAINTEKVQNVRFTKVYTS